MAIKERRGRERLYYKNRHPSPPVLQVGHSKCGESSCGGPGNRVKRFQLLRIIAFLYYNIDISKLKYRTVRDWAQPRPIRG